MANKIKPPNKKQKRYKWIWLFLLIFLLILLITTAVFIPEHFIAISVLFLISSFIPLMIRFERKKVTSREMVMLAILGAIGAVARVPFASLPSVQPTTFVIIITGAVFGAESGFVVGALAALVSNLFLGQGPWTPWQMYAWGMIGLFAGLCKSRWIMISHVGRILFGFIIGFAFGWFMNLSGMLFILQDFSWQEVIAYYSASFYFDLAHALSNVFFLSLFSKRWIKILTRFKAKYGLLETE